MDSIDLAQNRDRWRALLNMVMNLRVPYNAGKFLSICKTGGFTRRAQFRAVSYNFNYFLATNSGINSTRQIGLTALLVP
jgi:hypothetical protein